MELASRFRNIAVNPPITPTTHFFGYDLSQTRPSFPKLKWSNT
jgi:hypothetical protein